MYNDKTGKCFAKNISIDGRSAQTTGGTTCASYVPGGTFLNAEFADDFMEMGRASGVQNIKCEAMNCRFNNNTKCTAGNVKINSQNASCETFQP